MIGGVMTGLMGLPDILDALAEEGIPADAPGLGARLVAEVRKHNNYVPHPAVAQYENA